MSRAKFDEAIAAMFSNSDYKEYLFYAHIIGQCQVEIVDEDFPAAVSFKHNKYTLYISPKKFDVYTLEQRLAILKHECLHILNGHLTVRSTDKIWMKWNIATDCAINQLINQDHLPNCVLPKSLEEELGVAFPLLESSEFYYNLLLNSEKESNQQPDNHDVWSESEGDGDFQNDITKQIIDKAATSTLRDNGKLPKEYNEWLEIHSKKSSVDWRKALRLIVGNRKSNKRKTIKRKDRRFSTRNDLKGNVKDRTYHLLLILDVSGSVSTEELLSTLSEVQNICKITNSDLTLIQVDTKPHKPEKFTASTKLFERKAHGGTFLSSAIEMAKTENIEYNGVVVVTDGYLAQEDLHNFYIKKPVIFLITENGITNDLFKCYKMEK